MLRSINEIIGYTLMATDGEIGKCDDFLFEDRPWIIRYAVAKTGNWLFDRKVLLFLITLEKPDWNTMLLHVNLTKQQIKDSPPLDDDAPISRQYEKQSFLYYGWPAYWAHSAEETSDNESFLRSVKEVSGYSAWCGENKAGKVFDFIVDDSIWAIRYIAIKTNKDLGGNKVLVAPEWVRSVDLISQSVHIDLTKELLENCPDYNPEEPVNRDFESILYDYYGRPYYWESDEADLIGKK
ncbi:PRC-barrel domain-containing protein [Thermodesulfobacteriota bacterium]